MDKTNFPWISHKAACPVKLKRKQHAFSQIRPRKLMFNKPLSICNVYVTGLWYSYLILLEMVLRSPSRITLLRCFVPAMIKNNEPPRPLRWRHNGRDGVSNHQPHDYLLNRLFRRRSKKTPKLRVTGLCAWNSPETGEFPAQMASNAENVSIWWRHHGESTNELKTENTSHWRYKSGMTSQLACHWTVRPSANSTFNLCIVGLL